MTDLIDSHRLGGIPAKRKIFIVDDHPIFRMGVAFLISKEPDLAICGQASSAVQALSSLRTYKTDLVMVDVSLPGANGLELIKQIRAEHERLAILAVSVHDERDYAMRAMRAGAGGYLMKRESPETLLAGLRKVLQGEVAVSATFGDQLIYKAARGQQNGGSPVDVLSDRELEILALVGQGHSSKEMADLLHLSVKTVESHRLHIKEKLGFTVSGEMVRFAVDWAALQTEGAK